MRIHPHRDRNVVNHLRRKNPIVFDFPRIQNFASQRKNRLALLVAPLFGGTSRAVAFDEKEFIAGKIRTFAVGEFSGEHGDRRSLLLFHFLRLALPLFGLINHEFGKFLPVFDVIIQPIFKLRTHKPRNQPQRIAARQFLFRLSLELGIQGLTGQDETRAGKNVFGKKLHALRHETVRFHKSLHGPEKSVPQPRLVRAACGRRNEVHKTLAGQSPFRRPKYDPGGAFARRKPFRRLIGPAFGFKRGHHRRIDDFGQKIFL